MDTSHFEERAQLKYLEAQKTLGKRSIFSKEKNIERGCELLIEAANNWKSAKNFRRAAEAYEQSAQALGKIEESTRTSMQHWREAGMMWRRCDESAKAMYAMRQYCELTLSFGKPIEAGKTIRSMAEVAEKDGNFEEAIELYKKAVLVFTGEERAQVELRNTKLKLAEMLSLRGDYEEAITLYEEAALDCVDNKLVKWTARNHFLRAFVCTLVLRDKKRALESYQRYMDIDPTLAGSPEYDLMEGVCEALEDDDVDKFMHAVARYNDLKKLDEWLTDMFLKIKEWLMTDDHGMSEESDSDSL